MNFAMATLGLMKMGKFPWEGREKSLPSLLSQFSFARIAMSLKLPSMANEYYEIMIIFKNQRAVK